VAILIVAPKAPVPLLLVPTPRCTWMLLTDEEKSVATATTKVNEVKELVKDVTETEIKSLRNDTKLRDERNIQQYVAEDK